MFYKYNPSLEWFDCKPGSMPEDLLINNESFLGKITTFSGLWVTDGEVMYHRSRSLRKNGTRWTWNGDHPIKWCIDKELYKEIRI